MKAKPDQGLVKLRWLEARRAGLERRLPWDAVALTERAMYHRERAESCSRHLYGLAERGLAEDLHPGETANGASENEWGELRRADVLSAAATLVLEETLKLQPPEDYPPPESLADRPLSPEPTE